MSESDEAAEPSPETKAQVQADISGRLSRLEHVMLRGGDKVLEEAGRFVVPAWRSITEGEPRWPVSLAIVAAIVLQLALPTDFTVGAGWFLPALELALLVFLVASNPLRINRRSQSIRAASIGLIVVISVANAYAAGKLVHDIIEGTGPSDARTVLGIGASVWLTNVIVFGLWYWDLDRGGPAARARGERPYPDFLFPQMQDETHAYSPASWTPNFIDYLYVSFTNATAFSPTDTLPLVRWAKLTMLLQSAVSLVTVGLVIARAVNILK
jgi:hypothetical protein